MVVGGQMVQLNLSLSIQSKQNVVAVVQTKDDRSNTVHVGLFNPIHKGPKTPKLQCKCNTIQGVGIQIE